MVDQFGRVTLFLCLAFVAGFAFIWGMAELGVALRGFRI